jgi:membrane glycosyltransferase
MEEGRPVRRTHGHHPHLPSSARMRQSLNQFERAFHQETELDQQRRQDLRRSTEIRARQRTIQRNRKRSSLRFYMLTLSLIITAVVVTAVMLGTMYLLLR